MNGQRGRQWRPLSFALLAAALTLAGCGGSAGAPATTPQACSAPPEGIGPDAAATLQVEDANSTYCLNAGDVLTVFLRVPLEQAAAGWQPVHASDQSVLQPMNAGVLTLPRGVTGAVYRAQPGVAQLTSVRAPCASPDAGCATDLVWRVSIVVRASPP
jgi:hypothetical protein